MLSIVNAIAVRQSCQSMRPSVFGWLPHVKMTFETTFIAATLPWQNFELNMCSQMYFCKVNLRDEMK